MPSVSQVNQTNFPVMMAQMLMICGTAPIPAKVMDGGMIKYGFAVEGMPTSFVTQPQSIVTPRTLANGSNSTLAHVRLIQELHSQAAASKLDSKLTDRLPISSFAEQVTALQWQTDARSGDAASAAKERSIQSLEFIAHKISQRGVDEFDAASQLFALGMAAAHCGIRWEGKDQTLAVQAYDHSVKQFVQAGKMFSNIRAHHAAAVSFDAALAQVWSANQNSFGSYSEEEQVELRGFAADSWLLSLLSDPSELGYKERLSRGIFSALGSHSVRSIHRLLGMSSTLKKEGSQYFDAGVEYLRIAMVRSAMLGSTPSEATAIGWKYVSNMIRASLMIWNEYRSDSFMQAAAQTEKEYPFIEEKVQQLAEIASRLEDESRTADNSPVGGISENH